MSTHSIHGNLLYVTVINCNKLKDTEWISRQDPYVCIEYGGNKFQTCTCTDGGKNPTFQEKFVYTLTEGLRELNVTVWNSNNIIHDYFIGSGKVPLSKALSKGFDDNSWPLQTRNSRHAGEVRLIIEYCNVNKTANNKIHAPGVQLHPQPPLYVAQPVPPAVLYPPQAVGYPPVGSSYPAPAPASAPSPYYPSYQQKSGAYYNPYPPHQPAPYYATHPNPAYPQPDPYAAQPAPSSSIYPKLHESYIPPCSCYPDLQPQTHMRRK